MSYDYGRNNHSNGGDHYAPYTNNTNQYYPSQSTTSSEKQFLFAVEDFLDKIRKLKSDFSSNGSLGDIGHEPTQLFDDIKYHLNNTNRIESDSFNRLLDGVKILKKLQSRCLSSFRSWHNLNNLLQIIDNKTHTHSHSNSNNVHSDHGIVASREREAKQRLAFLQRQKMQSQPQPAPPPHPAPTQHHHHAPPSYNNQYNNNYNAPPPPTHGPSQHQPTNYYHHSRRYGHYRPPPPYVQGSPQERRSVYVYGFPRKWGITELQYLFDSIGETEDVDILRRGDTAFVHYIHPQDAHQAVDQMNLSCPLYCKRPINVEIADKSRFGVGMSKSDICWLYNQRTCQYGMSCSKQHICSFCRGGHPQKQCNEIDKHFNKLKTERFDFFDPNAPPTYKNAEFEVTVDDIPMNAANERDLRLLFNGIGPIQRIKIMKPRNRNMKVRAYIEFFDEKTVQNALKLNGTVWMNDTITVRRASSGSNDFPQNRYSQNQRPYNYGNGPYGGSRDNMSHNASHGGMGSFDHSRNNHYDHRSRSRDRYSQHSAHSDDYNHSHSHYHKSTRAKPKSVDVNVGGCIQKENGKIIIERKYQLTEVCTTFNGVTGCFSSDCEKIHVCSLCECEDHSLPKCPRTNTKIGEILMKQLQKENHQKGAAMTRIELNQKNKKRTFSAMDGDSHRDKEKYIKRERKRIKMNDDMKSNIHDRKDASFGENKAMQITHLEDMCTNYLFFLLDGNVWRRAIVLNNDGDSIRVHYMGWDAKYDEKLSIQRDFARIRIFKPSTFRSEATMSKELVSKLKNIRSQSDMDKLDEDKVKNLLKLCQLKHDGPIGLLRERLMNVIDEIAIKDIDERNRMDVIGVNMRRINELYDPTSVVKRERLIKEEECEIKVDEMKEDDGEKKKKKPKIDELCSQYNTAKGCLLKDCQYMHECDLCGSEFHINLDCPNHTL